MDREFSKILDATPDTGSYDVVAVSLDDNTVRIMDRNKTERNAEAVIGFAIMRRGVDSEFYAAVPSGTYKDGDEWKGK